MPLDPVARRYADTLFTDAMEKTAEKLPKDLAKVHRDHSARKTLMSGLYITDCTKVYLEYIDSQAKARMESLIKAYEKSELPFDESAHNEVKGEVMGFCLQQQHHAVSAIGRLIQQTFQNSAPVDLENAEVEQLRRGIDGIMARLSRALSIKRDERLLDDMKVRKAYAAGLGKKWDVFICHATEDKDAFARPLAKALEASGLSVWYDELTLKIGDSLRQKIEEGLAHSRFGIVVLSDSFFAKRWPQNELDGLASKELAGTKVILPVWHSIDCAEVNRHAPMLSGRVAAKSSDGVPEVVRQLRDAMGL